MSDIKKVKSQVPNELDVAQKQFEAFDQNLQSMTMDRMNQAPKQEVEAQTKLSSREMANSKVIYLKPHTRISCHDKFNEKYRDDYNHACEIVSFIAENREIIGEDIELWTRPFGGMPAEFWKVPTNKLVHGPRYLAEQIKKCSYHRFTMQQNVMTDANYVGQMYGAMAVDSIIQRLDAIPGSTRKSIFMGASGF